MATEMNRNLTYDSNNIFAKIIRGEIPCNRVYETTNTLAFRDISPQAPVHVLVIPKGSYVSFADFIEKASSEEVSEFFRAVGHTAELLGLVKDGYRIIANHGILSGQEVPHFHVHILSGKPLGALITVNN